MCQDNISQAGCRRGNTCFFRHVELAEKPNKKSKKDGAKGSVAILKELAQMKCVSQDLHPKKTILRKERQEGTHARKERVHSEVLFRSVRSLCAPKICGNISSVYFAARAVRPRSRVEPGKNIFLKKTSP